MAAMCRGTPRGTGLPSTPSGPLVCELHRFDFRRAQPMPVRGPCEATLSGVQANDRTTYLGKRRRLMGPAEVSPVIVSRPTWRSENFASESDNLRRSPTMTGETSAEIGRAHV